MAGLVSGYHKSYKIHRLDGSVVRSPILPPAYEIVQTGSHRGEVVEHHVTSTGRPRGR